MDENQRLCSGCGRELPRDAPAGLCPHCLINLAQVADERDAPKATAPMLLRTVEADEVLGEEGEERYAFLSEQGRGGMGRVLLVHDQRLGRDIALKELLPEGLGEGEKTPTPVRHSKEMVGRFLREARITGQLEHPSITPVHELGRREDGTLYYTMKLVRGKTLSAALKEAKTLRERLKLLPHLLDLCQAIAYAHSRGVIHRDIKPDNVMIGDFGETVVIDWGLAKVKGKEESQAAAEEDAFMSVRFPRTEGDDVDTCASHLFVRVAAIELTVSAA